MINQTGGNVSTFNSQQGFLVAGRRATTNSTQSRNIIKISRGTQKEDTKQKEAPQE